MMQALAPNRARHKASKWGFIVTPRAWTAVIVAAFSLCFEPHGAMIPAEMPRIFVYGTLKRGFSNAVQLEGAAFERTAATANGYLLHMVSGYPAMSRSDVGVVHGELYGVTDDQLRYLDEFEGAPEAYQREAIRLEDGTEAQAYVVSAERVHGLVPIDEGRFSS
jgi:gamma-glutamylcyclotransferase (GGCT)/AIG2-like uncharacterized protein YtfP